MPGFEQEEFHAYPGRLLEPVDMRNIVRRRGTVLVRRDATRPAAAEYPPRAAYIGLRGVLVRDHDVQHTATGRHHRSRRGHGYRSCGIGTMGLDAGGLGGALYPGAFLRRWRCHRF